MMSFIRTTITIILLLVTLFSSLVIGQTWMDLLDQADSLASAKQYDSAVVCSKIVLDEIKTENGLYDSTIVDILMKIGGYYQDSQNCVEAEKYFTQSLMVADSVLDPFHPKAASALHNIGIACHRQKRYDQADSLYSEALLCYEQVYGETHPKVAMVLDSRAGLYADLREYKTAESLYVRSIEIWQNTPEPNEMNLAKTLYNLAILKEYQGMYDQVIMLLESALDIRERKLGSNNMAVARVLNNLGRAYGGIDQFVVADSLFRRSLAIREELLGVDHPSVATVLNNLAIICRRTGDYNSALEYYDRAHSIRVSSFGNVHPKVAQSNHNLAIVFRDLGRIEKSEQAHRRAIATLEKTLGRTHPKTGQYIGDLAQVLDEQGRFAEAELLYDSALAIARHAYGREHPNVASVLNDLAITYKKQGRYDKAVAALISSLRIWEKIVGHTSNEIAESYNNLANTYIYLGRFTEAESLYVESIKIRRELLGDWHIDVAVAMDNLAKLYWREERYEEAAPIFQKALEISKQAIGEMHPTVARILKNMANLYRDQRRYEESEPLYQMALDIRTKIYGNDHYEVAVVYDEYCKLHRLQGNLLNALEYARRACRIRRRDLIDNARVLSEEDALSYSQSWHNSVNQYISCYYDIMNTEYSLDETMPDIAIQAKGYVSDEVFERQRSITLESDSTVQNLAKEYYAAKYQLSRMFVRGSGEDVLAYSEKVDSLTQYITSVEASLARHSSIYSGVCHSKDITTNRITSMLPNNSILLEYLKYNYYLLKPDTSITRYLVVILKQDEPAEIEFLGDASDIDPLVQEYREHMQTVSEQGIPPTEQHLEDYRKISRKLYGVLVQPLEKSFSEGDLLLIAPDGLLNMVSFVGIIDNDSRYLIENHAIHYVSSGRDLIRMAKESESTDGLFAFGDPDFNAVPEMRVYSYNDTNGTTSNTVTYALRGNRSGCEKLNTIEVTPLPNTRYEIEVIATQWEEQGLHPISTYYGPEASEEIFKAMAPGNRLIHLATHGYYLDDVCQPAQARNGITSEQDFVGENPLLLSGLFLAGANLHGEGPESISFEDGILTAYEVSAMDLQGTDMVVLSACETGLGSVVTGEGVYGLRRAFQMAGARTILSSLWRVSDAATADFMKLLYETKGDDLAEILAKMYRRKLIDLRKRNQPDHPYNWAAFMAIGDIHTILKK